MPIDAQVNPIFIEKVTLDLFDDYLPVNRHELRMGISVRKEILRRRGAMAHSSARYPVPELSGRSMDELANLLDRLERRTGTPISAIVGG